MTPLPALLHPTQSRVTVPSKKASSQRNSLAVLEKQNDMITPTLSKTATMSNNSDDSINLNSNNSRKLSSDNSSMDSLSKCEDKSQVDISQNMQSNENGTAKPDHESEEKGVSECGKNQAATTDAIATSTRPQRILLKNINDHISCSICSGYLIDATTIVECLHSFCRSCIMNHLKQEHSCPQCKMVINTAKPNIKSDTTLQAIVYKLVPGLYEKELMRKRAFYRDRPKDAMLASPEQRGDDTENLIFGPTENMSLSLEYADLEDITSGDISALKSPKYLQCPAIFSVAHLKKFIVYKFAVDYRTFNIEIMYKVKTIVLPDHYTLMDVAYIYTWKRDAPMRFFFRVRENNTVSMPDEVYIKEEKNTTVDAEVIGDKEPESSTSKVAEESVVKLNTSADLNEQISENAVLTESKETEQIVPVVKIEESVAKPEVDKQKSVTQPTTTETPKSTVTFSLDYREPSPKADKIKLTLVNKNKMSKNGAIAIYESNIEKSSDSRSENTSVSSKPSKSERSSKTGKSSKHHQSQRESGQQHHHHQKVKEGEERKVENIKLKIDLSKQSSITIINMSSPDSSKKESSKSSKSDKEWKLKSRKDKDDKLGTLKTFVTTSNVKRTKSEKAKDDSKKAIRITNIHSAESKGGKSSESSLKSPTPKESNDFENVKTEKNEEEMKSEFLNSFALTPIKACGIQEKASKTAECDSTKKAENVIKSDVNALCIDSLMPPIPTTTIKLPVTAPKRKTKEPPKQPAKRFKEEVQEMPPPSAELKRKTPPKAPQDEPKTISFKLAPFPIGGAQNSSIDLTKDTDEKLMPAPPPLKILRAFKPNDGNSQKNSKSAKSLTTAKAKVEAANNSFYKPIFTAGVNKPAPPGSRTPTTRRYPYILPRPNPFANIQADVSKTMQSNDAELKNASINFNCDIKMCPPPVVPENPTAPSKPVMPNSIQPHHSPAASHHKPKQSAQTNYLNLALLNATKGKVSDFPLGSRTPLYTPNSPIYSPNSPQYMPNYNIPTQPTYKYTKSQSNVSKYLSTVLGQNQQLSGLFPAPPVKKSNDIAQPNITSPNGDSFTVKKIDSPNKSAPIETLENDETTLKSSPKVPGNAPYTSSDTLKKSISKSADSTTSNSAKTCEDKMKQTYEENKGTQSYSFANSLNSIKCEGVSEPPEKQAKVKSLLNSCKINIPSSLSITITTEENDSQSKSSTNSKLKSPVNNYIEILKLPENPPAKSNSGNNSDIKVTQRLYGPQMRHMPQSLESSLSNFSNEGSGTNESNMSTKSVSLIQGPKTSPTHQLKSVAGPTFNRQSPKEQVSQAKIEKKTVHFAPEKSVETLKGNTNKSPKNLPFPLPEKESENPSVKASLSPPKHSGTSSSTTPKNNKSSKEQEISPSKKFRPILPRMELSVKDTPKPILPSSPPTLLNNSVSMHNKPEKKSPPLKTAKTAPKAQKTTKKNAAGQAKNVKATAESKLSVKKADEIVDLTGTPPLNTATNPLPNESHLEKATDEQSNTNAQAEKTTERPVDVSNFIEKSMRQLHSSNDIYMSNLAAAASFNPHFASVNLGYNLHQAMLLEQFSRIQKAGRDAYERFIENSKTKTDGSITPKEEPESLQPKISPTPVSSENTKR